MKVENWREMFLRLRVEFPRGFLEATKSKNFSKVVLDASPEAYDYSNWTDEDLKDLRDAINAFLEEKNKEEV